MMILYFAYGSNMLSSRLTERVPSKTIGRATLNDCCVVFNKKSKDGSGKANLLQKTGAITWGILYEIDANRINLLDNVEKGYKRTTVQVNKDSGEEIDSQTYISDNLIDNPIAFDSYKQILISGALEHHLPEEYILYLQRLPSRPEKTD